MALYSGSATENDSHSSTLSRKEVEGLLEYLEEVTSEEDGLATLFQGVTVNYSVGYEVSLLEDTYTPEFTAQLAAYYERPKTTASEDNRLFLITLENHGILIPPHWTLLDFLRDRLTPSRYDFWLTRNPICHADNGQYANGGSNGDILEDYPLKCGYVLFTNQKEEPLHHIFGPDPLGARK